MNYTNNITVLIADNDESHRQYLAGIFEAHGYQVLQALDGGTAINVVENNPVDLAVISAHMTPRTGWEFARHLLSKAYRIGVIMIAEDYSADLLHEAGKYQIKQILSRPIDGGQIIETARRVLKSMGKNPDALAGRVDRAWSPAELMERVLALAEQNALTAQGGPFAALVTDAQGHILGEGVNSVRLRHDPTAHAEILAIRRATEKKGALELEDCTLYASSEPTMLGQALIIGTGIKKVVYGLTHEETGRYCRVEPDLLAETAKPREQRQAIYEQYMHEEALAMFETVTVAQK